MASTARRVAKARKARSQIAKTFAALDNGHISILSVLNSPPACLGRIRVYDVLRRCPHLGRNGAEKLLRHARVWPLTTMDNLTEDERRRIVLSLPPRSLPR